MSLIEIIKISMSRMNPSRGCSISLNGVNTSVDLNIISLGYYDILIGMDWLEKHTTIQGISISYHTTP
jgi:hypothetical protein